MLAGIDHLVILVSELETAIESYRAQGFTVVPGGRHPTRTHNALIGFADGTYLELLAFYEPNPQSRWWGKLAQGGGLIAACLQTDDLRSELRVFRKAGMGLSDPTPLSRMRPDGYHLKWVLSVYQGDSGLIPFLIEDETPRDERVPKDRRHRNGATGIGTVTFVTHDLPKVRGWYTGVLGNPGQDLERRDLNASGVCFMIGPHRFDFVKPRRPDGPLHEWLRSRGASPYSLTLTTESGGVLQPVISPTRADPMRADQTDDRNG
jgi:catechol 2,3-dioxygenase-like lactoylglutathione lyase family enzyme